LDLTVYTDGGARGNPGPGAIGILLLDGNQQVVERHSEAIGVVTNNQAEYKALIKGLELARKHGAKNLKCFSDSQLVMKQASGEYRVKNQTLKTLHRKLKTLEAEFDSIQYTHTPRTNKHIQIVDALLNERLDEL
jgi:ribonuclease HI